MSFFENQKSRKTGNKGGGFLLFPAFLLSSFIISKGKTPCHAQTALLALVDCGHAVRWTALLVFGTRLGQDRYTMDLKELLKAPPLLHDEGGGTLTSWQLPTPVLEFIDGQVNENSKTVETGSGLSTI